MTQFHSTAIDGRPVETADDAREAVAEGVAALDRLFPTWPQQLNRSSFRFTDMRYCVLGQLYVNYRFAPQELKDLAAFWSYAGMSNNSLIADEWERIMLEIERGEWVSATVTVSE